MLSKKRQQDFFSDRLQSVLHNYELFSKHTRTENIHKIRVALKKIRALIYMQKKTGGSPNPKALKFLLRLFKQAGKVRDAQVSSALMKKIKAGDVSFFSHQREIVAAESKQFNELVSRHVDELVTACSKQWKSFSDIPKKKVEGMNKLILKKIKPVFFPRLKQSELHESRKFIKRLVYINSMLKANDPSRINTDNFRKLEEAIGKWHDAVVTQKLLTKFSPGKSVSRLLDLQKKRSLELAGLLVRKCFQKNKT